MVKLDYYQATIKPQIRTYIKDSLNKLQCSKNPSLRMCHACDKHRYTDTVIKNFFHRQITHNTAPPPKKTIKMIGLFLYSVQEINNTILMQIINIDPTQRR